MNGIVQQAVSSDFLSVEDYLEGERLAPVKHEYVGGQAYAMAGASEEHNSIVTNLLAALHAKLRGKRCKVLMADMKLRLSAPGTDTFYYPDLMVVCDERDTDRYFKRFPTVIIEVLSPDTERIDRREKFLSYLQIETLQEYILVAQDKREVTVFRRALEWEHEILKSDDTLRLDSIQFSMAIADVYEGVT